MQKTENSPLLSYCITAMVVQTFGSFCYHSKLTDLGCYYFNSEEKKQVNNELIFISIYLFQALMGKIKTE